MALTIIIISLITLLSIFLIMNITTVISMGGYKKYLHQVKLLHQFKSVDKKINHKRTVTYNFTNGGRQSTITQSEYWNYCFYYMNSEKFLQVSYKGKGHFSIGINFFVQRYDYENKVYRRKEYFIKPMPDIIIVILYSKLVKKVKSHKAIEVDNEKDLVHETNKGLLKKTRENSLSSILN